MMTQELGMCVVSAPLAAIDRRALSQAWYSALHLARDAAGVDVPRGRAALPTMKHETDRSQHPSAREKKAFRVERSVLRTRGALARHGIVAERRAQRTPLARRIERVFLRPGHPPRRGSFAIDGCGARVHVTLETRPYGTHLIAVCAPAHRGVVARALDDVRFALAARGTSLRVTLED